MRVITAEFKTGFIFLLVITLLNLPCPAPLQAGIRFGNGVNATVYSPAYIMEEMVVEDGGRPVLYVDGKPRYELVPDVYDPAVSNRGDGQFHPFDRDDVIQALEQIDLNSVSMDVSVEIYILPLPRRYILRSTSSGNRIFLSPGVYPVSMESVSFTVTHEFGHSYANRYLPGSGEDRWHPYLLARGLEGDDSYTSRAAHRNRPAELFAEDFRYLFGGEASNYSGTIENSRLVPPDEIAGLEDFFVALAGGMELSGDRPAAGIPIMVRELSSYPNPFNPSTSITALFSDGVSPGYVDVKVYSVDGSLIRNLFSGRVGNDELSVQWDGRDSRGRRVESGVYFCRLKCGGERVVHKMILIR